MGSVTGIHAGSRNLNGADLNSHTAPSSSILAGHFAPTNRGGLPRFDRESFTQLIKESLGHDEDGQSNIGPDAEVNHKLICIIVKAGIDDTELEQDSPFSQPGRSEELVLRCLQVIGIAIQRSPNVLYARSGPGDLASGDENVPLFLWLLPKLLSLVVHGINDHESVSEHATTVLRQTVEAAAQCSSNHEECNTLNVYLDGITSGSMAPWHMWRL